MPTRLDVVQHFLATHYDPVGISLLVACSVVLSTQRRWWTTPVPRTVPTLTLRGDTYLPGAYAACGLKSGTGWRRTDWTVLVGIPDRLSFVAFTPF